VDVLSPDAVTRDIVLSPDGRASTIEEIRHFLITSDPARRRSSVLELGHDDGAAQDAHAES